MARRLAAGRAGRPPTRSGPIFDALPEGAGGFAGARENVAVDQAELFEAAQLTELAGAIR